MVRWSRSSHAIIAREVEIRTDQSGSHTSSVAIYFGFFEKILLHKEKKE